MVKTAVVQEQLDTEFKRYSRKVASWLLFYEERKAEYERQREAVIESSPPCLLETPGSKNSVSDPTGRKVVQLARLQETEKWLRLVEEVEQRLPEKLQVVLKLRREANRKHGIIHTGRYKGRPAWIPYVQHKYAEVMAEKLNKRKEDVWIESPQTFSEWWGKIVDYAVLLAAKKGLL